MYSKFTTISLKEYNKIISVMNSIDFEETMPEQFVAYYSVVYNMMEHFADNLDYRDYKLKKNINILHIIDQFKDWKNFRDYATMLVNNITEMFKQWGEIGKKYYGVDQEDTLIDDHIQINGI